MTKNFFGGVCWDLEVSLALELGMCLGFGLALGFPKGKVKISYLGTFVNWSNTNYLSMRLYRNFWCFHVHVIDVCRDFFSQQMMADHHPMDGGYQMDPYMPQGMQGYQG
jgi:hypothetical protein